MSDYLRFNCHKCNNLVTMKKVRTGFYRCPNCYTIQGFETGIEKTTENAKKPFPELKYIYAKAGRCR